MSGIWPRDNTVRPNHTLSISLSFCRSVHIYPSVSERGQVANEEEEQAEKASEDLFAGKFFGGLWRDRPQHQLGTPPGPVPPPLPLCPPLTLSLSLLLTLSLCLSLSPTLNLFATLSQLLSLSQCLRRFPCPCARARSDSALSGAGPHRAVQSRQHLLHELRPAVPLPHPRAHTGIIPSTLFSASLRFLLSLSL